MIAAWLLLAVLCAASYFYGKRDFASPFFLLCVSFWMMFSVVFWNYDNWDIQHHHYYSQTTLLIVIFIFSFFLGTFFVRKLTDLGDEEYQRQASGIIAERGAVQYPYGFFAVISVVLMVLFLFTSGVPAFSSLSAFKNSLRATYEAGREGNFVKSQIFELLTAIAYISLHRYMVDRFFLKRKSHFFLIVPIACFLLFVLFSTDRNQLLRFFITGLVLFVMSYDWQDLLHGKNKSLVRKVIVLVVAAAFIFWGFGKLKNYTSNFERAIGIYSGSGIYAFNLWLHRFDGHFTRGIYTFQAIDDVLAAFGIGTGARVPEHMEFIIYRSPNGYVFATNIYSALRIYYEDFGIAGLIIIPFLSGGFFESLYQMAVRNKFGFWWLFYAAHIYPVIYYPITEQFICRFHLGLIYEVFWLAFFYLLVYSKRGLWRVRTVIS